jgi:formylglycine-generating enzyme required for sulfatase activity
MLPRGLLIAYCVCVAALTANSAWAEPPRPKDGPLGMKFVPLPKATFYMGWDSETKTRGTKKEIEQDFEIAVHTVTQAQWQELMGNNPSHFSRAGEGKDRVKDIADADLKQFPVERVSWDDAQEFIKKLNEKERGRGWLYRLPMEREWEYACRGGATSEEECSYHFYLDKPTNDLSSKQANFHGEYPFGKADKGPRLGRTTKVGSYPPNKLGLYDMHGNVGQWCSNLFALGSSRRVIKGGAWDSDGSNCRAGERNNFPRTDRAESIGFRLVRVPSGGK